VELEAVAACPVCTATARRRLWEIADQRRPDRPERWTFWSCLGCGAAFLDPRPTQATLAEAYAGYYTHVPPALEPEPAGAAGRLRRALRNGYVNGRFGYAIRPAAPAALAAAALAPMRSLRAEMQRSFRHLPGRGRLLDVGCASGTFIALAQTAGWSAVGIDVDEEAVALGRGHGFDLRVETLDDHAAQHAGEYDAITMGHVIEHVHDPVGFLELARRALRPGGTIWIATPNLGSAGHARFRASWVGLDPPRHLVLFDRASLEVALTRAGFAAMRHVEHDDAAAIHFAWSRQIAAGEAPAIHAPPALPRRAALSARVADLRARRDPGRGEELVVLAQAAG
jgi:SAM-dependent methyltransferase